MTIKERFPKGLNKTITHLHEAMYTALRNGETDRVAKHSGIKERHAIRKLEKLIGKTEIQSLDIWPILDYLTQCPHLLEDVVAYMLVFDNETYTPEEVEERFTKRTKELEEAESNG